MNPRQSVHSAVADDTKRDFHYVSLPQEVIFGRGAVRQLPEALDRHDCRRLMLFTSRSLRANGHLDLVKSALGSRLLQVFDLTQPHVPDYQVEEALERAVAAEADSVLGLGGGSPIGLAKAVAHALSQKRPDAPFPPLIAIPTTYAGSEMTGVYGITHTRETPPRKVTITHPQIAPRLVIYDPELTFDLPPNLTASTGVNALAHCLEALYSITRNPASSAVAVSGTRLISGSLLKCYQDGSDAGARTHMLTGSHLAGLSLASVSMGIHHGLCHVLGGTADVPHGIANSIVLPHAIRFNAGVAAEELLPAAEAMGMSPDGRMPVSVIESLADSIYATVGGMGLPQRLREVGIPRSDLGQLAQMAFENKTVKNNPRPIRDAGEIESLLQAAW